MDFAWYCCPPRGRSGGILLGVKTDSMEVLAVSDGDFNIKLHILNKSNNFKWSLVTVYGPAQKDHKAAFLRELVNLAKDNPHPTIIGGTSICYNSHSRKVRDGLTIIGLSCSMSSLTAWI